MLRFMEIYLDADVEQADFSFEMQKIAQKLQQDIADLIEAPHGSIRMIKLLFLIEAADFI